MNYSENNPRLLKDNKNLIKIKYLCKNAFSGGTPRTDIKEFWENGNIKWIASGEIQNCEVYNFTSLITDKGLRSSSTRLFPYGTILMAMTGATCGNVGISKIDKACANQSVFSFILNSSQYPKFYYYYLISIKEEILINKNGGAQAGINGQVCKNLMVPYLSFKKQKKIADALDSIVLKIDKLSELKREQIRNLESYKQNLIEDVAINGLIFEERKKKIKLKYFCSSFSKSLTLDDLKLNYKYSVYGASGIIDLKCKFAFCNVPYIGIVKDGAGIGRCFLCKKNTSILGTMAYIIPNNNCDIKFLYYSLVGLNLNKAKLDCTTIPHIYFSDYGDKKILNITLNEQRKVVNFLDIRISLIDKLIESKKLFIKNLKKYKESIIYEYVSGKREA